jgi:hypothetical protein
VCRRKSDHHEDKPEQRAVPRADSESQREHNNPFDNMMRPKSKVWYVNHDLWDIMKPARKQVPMSALCQADISALFDHLIGGKRRLGIN